ncbi:hypothetical protein [Lewinella sp. LCG006]|uniref:hypothetical protein n=1 Tax=Lewinella sp. LCG006 TaxID=3231911 RepID=UPI00345FDC01
MKVNKSEAAKMVGITRATLYSHIEKKGITVEEDRDGNPVIDVSELIRVYGDKVKLAEDGPALNSDHTPKIEQTIQRYTPEAKQPIQNNTPHNTVNHTLAEIEVLKERIRNLETIKETLESERSRERDQLHEQIENLRENLEKSQSHHKQLTALLTDQRSDDERRNDTVHQQSQQIEDLMGAMHEMMQEKSREQKRIEILEQDLKKLRREEDLMKKLHARNKRLAREKEELEKEAKKTWFQKLLG